MFDYYWDMAIPFESRRLHPVRVGTTESQTQLEGGRGCLAGEARPNTHTFTLNCVSPKIFLFL